MRNKRYLFILLGLLGFISIPLNLVPAQIMNYFTGLLTETESIANDEIGIGEILPYILLFFLTATGVAVISVVREVLSGVYLENAIKDRSVSLYRKLLITKPEFFRNNEPAKISNRIFTESRAIEDFYLDIRMGIPSTVIGLLVFSIILFIGLDKETAFIGKYLPEGYSQSGNWFLAFMILLMAPLHGLFLVFDKKIQAVIAASAQAGDDMLTRSVESLNNIREIRNHFAFDYLLGRIQEVIIRLKDVQVRIVILKAIFY